MVMRAASWWKKLLALMLVAIWAAPALAADDRPAQQADSQAAETTKKDGDKKDDASLFIRVRHNDGGKPVALETALIQFEIPATEEKPARLVDLIGAIHVGEKTYYDDLNTRFAQYDALLYELVAPEDFKIEQGKRLESQSGVGAFQNALKSFLGLEFQLDCVDYSKANFVHADMSPEQFQKTMQERGESFLTYFLRMMGQGMAMQAKNPSNVSDAELIVALLRRDRAALKRVMAEQMSGMEDSLTSIASKDGSSTIITERNKKALEVLRRELDGGKQKVAIFYGAGHLSDMQARLLKDFGAKRTGEQWLTAWDLTTDHSKKRSDRN
jgi:uncharacterized protein YbaP (TraB family)